MIQSYFDSEKKAAFAVCALGIALSTAGFIFLLSAMPPFYTGLSVPFVGIGIVQVIVGASIARRSDFQAIDLQKMLGEDVNGFVALESPRMRNVMRKFVVYKWVEIACIILGLALILLNTELVFSKGLGAGLLAQGIFMLFIDFYAEKRGEKYLHFIDRVMNDE